MSTLKTKGDTPTKRGEVARRDEQGDGLWERAMAKANDEMQVEFGQGQGCQRCSNLFAYVLRDKTKRLYKKLRDRGKAKGKKGT